MDGVVEGILSIEGRRGAQHLAKSACECRGVPLRQAPERRAAGMKYFVALTFYPNWWPLRLNSKRRAKPRNQPLRHTSRRKS
jgi:hypothetical protein